MQNLKELRIKAGLTQMQLAAACEVSLTSVIKWENGAGKPSDENYQKLLKALEIVPFSEPIPEA